MVVVVVVVVVVVMVVVGEGGKYRWVSCLLHNYGLVQHHARYRLVMTMCVASPTPEY